MTEAIKKTMTFPVNEVRDVSEDGVAALDESLKSAGSGELIHAMDPKRIIPFSHGGPPVWSVAFQPTKTGHLVSTYGLCKAIDPDSMFDFELSMHIAATEGELPKWANFFLRQLVRYQIESEKELKVGDLMSIGEPITQMAMAPEHKGAMPSTDLTSIGVTSEPLIKSDIEIRRVVGINEYERRLAELRSGKEFMDLLQGLDPLLLTTLNRHSYTTEESIVKSIFEASESKGSDTEATVLPNIKWKEREHQVDIIIPGGDHARHFAKLLEARIPFGQCLYAHDFTITSNSQIAIGPADSPFAEVRGDVLVIGVLDVNAIISRINIEQDLGRVEFSIPKWQLVDGTKH